MYYFKIKYHTCYLANIGAFDYILSQTSSFVGTSPKYLHLKLIYLYE